jgi:protein-tyrosine phosphatase
LQADGRMDGVEVSSAGTVAVDGMPASEGARFAAKHFGFSLDDFRSRQLTHAICRDASLLVVMAKDHQDYIHGFEPGAVGKVMLLGEYLDRENPRDLPDPIGASHKYFLDIAGVIDRALDVMLEDWDDLKRRF